MADVKEGVKVVVEVLVKAVVKVLAKDAWGLVVVVQVVQELVKAPVNLDVREATNTKIMR